MKRTDGIRRTPMRSRSRNTGPSDEVVDLVLERAQWSCEMCLVALGHRRGKDWQCHHRRARRMGGSQLPDTNSPANLLVLCLSCHELVESERSAAYEGGWLVRQNADPAAVLVLIGAKRWVFLTADGKYADERCPECRCDPVLCETDDTGDHCEEQSCGSCLHGCPLDPVCVACTRRYDVVTSEGAP